MVRQRHCQWPPNRYAAKAAVLKAVASSGESTGLSMREARTEKLCLSLARSQRMPLRATRSRINGEKWVRMRSPMISRVCQLL